eukprot:TRINITY_DN49062_c0_g1_i1.p1 TRINITY_DN49062_c0_g1~~TRINITY_DN49062_c0_g1_i1.p1  ORF type:complete len:116 (-),score=23.88 TRINITY_DN49062_c0_g1_i1:44-391(-)
MWCRLEIMTLCAISLVYVDSYRELRSEDVALIDQVAAVASTTQAPVSTSSIYSASSLPTTLRRDWDAAVELDAQTANNGVIEVTPSPFEESEAALVTKRLLPAQVIAVMSEISMG